MIKNVKHLHGVYSIVPDEGGHDLWVEIGFATQHADGRGFDPYIASAAAGFQAGAARADGRES